MTEEERLAKEQAEAERNKVVQDDINEMDDIIEGKVVDLPPEEEPIEGVGDKVVAEAGVEDLIPIEERTPVEEKKVEGEDEYDFSFINELARQALGKPPTAPEVVIPQQAAPAPAPTPQLQAQPQQVVQPRVDPGPMTIPQDLVSVDEMTQAFESPEKMVQLFGKIYLRARADSVQQALMSLPHVVRPLVAQEAEIVDMVTGFYKENPELDKYRDFVQYCATQVESAHPDWAPRQVMAETAKVAKQRLPLLKEAASRQRQAKPSFVEQNQTSNKPKSAKVSRLEQELASMPDY